MINPFNRSLVAALALATLGACGSSVEDETFTRRGDSHPAAAGMLRMTKEGTNVVATIEVTGLMPNTEYAAHFHRMGTASTEACDSNGGISQGFPMFTTDANGAGTTTQTVAETFVANDMEAAYVNVHLASDLTIVPLCADL